MFAARIHVLDGLLEAQLLLRGHSRQGPGPAEGTLFDLGGGSLEIVCVEDWTTHITSLQIGAGRAAAWIMEGRPLAEIEGLIEREFESKCQTIRTLSGSVWAGAGGTLCGLRSVLNQSEDQPLRARDIARETERMKSSVIDPTDGCLREDMTINDFRGLMESAPEKLPERPRKVYLGGLLVLNAMCSHFSVKSLRSANASVCSGVLSLLQLMRPTALKTPGPGLCESSSSSPERTGSRAEPAKAH